QVVDLVVLLIQLPEVDVAGRRGRGVPAELLPILAGAGTGDETQRQVEGVAELVHLEVGIPGVVGIGDLVAIAAGEAGCLRAGGVGVPGGGLHALAEPQEIEGLPGQVHAVEGRIGPAGGIAAGEERAQAEVLAEIIGEAAHEQVLGGHRGPACAGERTGVHVQHAYGQVPGAACELHALIDGHGAAHGQADVARVERGETAVEVAVHVAAVEGEEAAAVQEELALLREEQREAAQVYLLRIRFGLGEVRIDRQRPFQLRREVVFHLAAHRRALGFGVYLVAAAQHVRVDLQAAAGLEARHAVQDAVARGAEGAGGRVDVGPLGDHGQARHRAGDVETPVVHGGIELQAAGAEGDLRIPAVTYSLGFNLPDAIPAKVCVRRAIRLQAVIPVAAGADAVGIGVLVVVESVDDDGDVVIGILVEIPLQAVDQDLVRLRVYGVHRDVQVVVVP